MDVCLIAGSSPWQSGSQPVKKYKKQPKLTQLHSLLKYIFYAEINPWLKSKNVLKLYVEQLFFKVWKQRTQNTRYFK